MFNLSNKSKEKLVGVKPDLIKIVHRAIQTTTVDFGVSEGLRTLERQKKLVAEGKSRTLNSKHLSGDAVDLFAYVDGKISWKENHYFEIALAMQLAAIEYKIILGWGGIWDKSLNNLSNDLKNEVEKYRSRFKSKNLNKKPFFDGPHFELRVQ
jgi:peptidoglycan L-alanyl-D-glutamate endopeptidase CwlK